MAAGGGGGESRMAEGGCGMSGRPVEDQGGHLADGGDGGVPVGTSLHDPRGGGFLSPAAGCMSSSERLSSPGWVRQGGPYLQIFVA